MTVTILYRSYVVTETHVMSFMVLEDLIRSLSHEAALMSATLL